MEFFFFLSVSTGAVCMYHLKKKTPSGESQNQGQRQKFKSFMFIPLRPPHQLDVCRTSGGEGHGLSGLFPVSVSQSTRLSAFSFSFSFFCCFSPRRREAIGLHHSSPSRSIPSEDVCIPGTQDHFAQGVLCIAILCFEFRINVYFIIHLKKALC